MSDIDKLLSRIGYLSAKNTALEAQNALLRAVAKLSREYQTEIIARWGDPMFMDWLVSTNSKMDKAWRAAVDGGALPSQWQQVTDKILDERHELWQQMADSDGGEMEEPIT